MKIIITESQYRQIAENISKNNQIVSEEDGLKQLFQAGLEKLKSKLLGKSQDTEDSTDSEESNVESNATDSSVVKQNKIDISKFKVDLENDPKNHKTYRPKGNWESDNAWDLKAPVGTKVNSFTKGVVSAKKDYGNQPSGVYGIGIIIKGEDNYPDIFYTHIKNVNLNVGDKVNVGDYVGEIMPMKGGPSHVHIGLPYGKKLKDYVV